MKLGGFGGDFGILLLETIGLWIGTEVAAMRTPIVRQNWAESAEVTGESVRRGKRIAGRRWGMFGSTKVYGEMDR